MKLFKLQSLKSMSITNLRKLYPDHFYVVGRYNFSLNDCTRQAKGSSNSKFNLT